LKTNILEKADLLSTKYLKLGIEYQRKLIIYLERWDETLMSTDRTTEMLNYLSAISRDVGEVRTEVRELRNEVRAITSRLDRLEARILENRADVRDLESRVSMLEGKQA
jgi:predicted  nucleic acid-binding Zn-ribbon protein